MRGRGIIVGLLVATVVAQAALADRPAARPAGGSGASATTPAAWCKALRGDPNAWAAFQASTPAASGKTFAQFFGRSRGRRNVLGPCVAWRAKQGAGTPAPVVRDEGEDDEVVVSLPVAEHCKAVDEGRESAPEGKHYRNIGDCLRDNDGK
jgi:hypothetical protein